MSEKKYKDIDGLMVRLEVEDDAHDIESLTQKAFMNVGYSNQKEYLIPGLLRADSELSASFVATQDDRVVGSLIFSRVFINEQFQDYYGLGPVSVLPQSQGQGIGSALIRRGLEHLHEVLGARGCVLLGNPDYYGRFGFKASDDLVYPGIDPKYFQVVVFRDTVPRGEVKFHSSFYL